MLADTLREMAAAGLKNALAVVLAAYSSYSSCRQYREDIERAQDEVGPSAPIIDKTRVFYNHPEFIIANSDRIREALAKFPLEQRSKVRVAFTGHSIPVAMARGSSYEMQLQETCRLVAADLGISANRWALVYQSRSGRPQDPWLGPDILDHLRHLKDQGTDPVIVHPVGFLSDHMEVLYDLDEEAMHLCKELGMPMVRSRTVGTHRGFIRMLCELICERSLEHPARRAPVPGPVRARSRHLPDRLLPPRLAAGIGRHSMIRVSFRKPWSFSLPEKNCDRIRGATCIVRAEAEQSNFLTCVPARVREFQLSEMPGNAQYALRNALAADSPAARERHHHRPFGPGIASPVHRGRGGAGL